MSREIWTVFVFIIMIISTQACVGGPTPPAESTPLAVSTPTLVTEATPLPASTEPPTQPPQPATPTEQPLPTSTLVPLTSTVELTVTEQSEPTSPPASSGPLDFAEPTRLDYWRVLDEQNGDYEATIILHITGGAPPYTVYQDETLMITTWESDPQLIFVARGCGALVHTITVESADGQQVTHDYWIPAPWC